MVPAGDVRVTISSATYVWLTSRPTLTSVITRLSDIDMLEDTVVGSPEPIATGKSSAWNKLGVVKLNDVPMPDTPQLFMGSTRQ